MSASVDERIVQMKFENGQFERAAKESLGTMQQLKNGLNFEGAAKGIAEIGNSVKNFSLDAMGSAVQSVSDKFSHLDVVAFTVMQNITNNALAMGKKVVSAFTIDPIKTGFQEYETQINATQTILANTKKRALPSMMLTPH